MCGEKVTPILPLTVTLGSPPRVRGEDGLNPQFPQHVRITPACAGRSIPYLKLKSLKEDHPRVCGEKVYGCSIHPVHDRITPACAGRRKPIDIYRIMC